MENLNINIKIIGVGYAGKAAIEKAIKYEKLETISEEDCLFIEEKGDIGCIESFIKGGDIIYTICEYSSETSVVVHDTIGEFGVGTNMQNKVLVIEPWVDNNIEKKEKLPYQAEAVVFSAKMLLTESHEITEDKEAITDIYDMVIDYICAIESATNNPGIINLDYADIDIMTMGNRYTLVASGSCVDGDNKAASATLEAIKKPCIANNISSCMSAVILVCSSYHDINISEISNVADVIRNEVHSDSNIMFGTVCCDTYASGITVSIILGLGEKEFGHTEIQAKKVEISGIPEIHELDEFFEAAVEYAKTCDKLTITMLQRKFSLGFPRAGRLLDKMIEMGYIDEKTGRFKSRS
ncbi:MAG: DNA translocase FtsK [Bacillota bacterium]